MTEERNKDESDGDAEEAPPVAAETPAPEDNAEATPDAGERATVDVSDNSGPGRPSRLPLLLSLLALLLATAALIATGWLAQRGPSSLSIANDASLQELAGAGQAAAAERRDNRQAVEAMQDDVRSAGDSLESLQRDLQQRLRPLEALPGRISGLESSLSALQGISSGLRDTWLLSETEYYLQIANAQLQLARNPRLAKIALELADERLASLGNPALTDVRRAIANEVRALDALDDVDRQGVALTLSSLAGAIESLPLQTNMVAPDFSDASVDPELSGVDRAWASLKNSLSDVISVRRSDQPMTPLLPPDAAYFLRSNLTLQLQSARLALLRGEQALYDQSLDDAAQWIAEYYDAGSTPVQSALDTIAELKDTRFREVPPDISGSLALLRQYMARQGSNGPAQ